MILWKALLTSLCLMMNIVYLFEISYQNLVYIKTVSILPKTITN